MRQFTDLNGRTWKLAINGAHVLQAKRTFGVYLPGMFAEKSKPLQDLIGDFEKCCGILWILIEPQAEEAGVNELDFVSGLGGDSYGDAINALIEALIDFFPQAAHRAALMESWKSDQQMTTATFQSVADLIRQQRSSINGSSSSQPSPA